MPSSASLPTARLKLIAYTAEVVRFAPGEVIVQQGDAADAVYIITEGEAGVWLHDHEGNEINLATMGPHSLFGETAVICRGQRTATVKAKGRVVTFKISANLFLDLVRSRYPKLRLADPAEELARLRVIKSQAEVSLIEKGSPLRVPEMEVARVARLKRGSGPAVIAVASAMTASRFSERGSRCGSERSRPRRAWCRR